MCPSISESTRIICGCSTKTDPGLGDNAANQRLELAVVLKFCQASRGAVGVTGNIADTDRRLAPLRPNGYQGNPGLLFVPGHQQRSISQPGKDDGDDLLDARGLNGAN